MIKKFVKFVKESWAELKRVTWPTKESLWGGTLGVVLLSTFFVIYMWVLDQIISRIVQLILR